MRTLPAALQSHLDLANTAFAIMVLITRKDGQRFGLTSYDRPLTFDLGDGAVTYGPSPSFAPTLFSYSQGLRDASGTLETVLDSGTALLFDPDAVRAGVWRDADYRIFALDPDDTAKGQFTFERGNLGNLTMSGISLTVEILRKEARFQQAVAETLTEGCPFVIGSTRGHGRGCKVLLDPGEWLASFEMVARLPRDAAGASVVRPVDALAQPIFNNRHYVCVNAGTTGATPPTFLTTIDATFADGTVTWKVIQALTAESTVDTVVDQRTFTVTGALDSPSGWFDRGFFEWTSGDNLSVGKVEALAWDSALQQITLSEPAYFTIQPGDGFKVSAGCDHVLAGDCTQKFDNAHNYGGLPFTPGTTRIQEIVTVE